MLTRLFCLAALLLAVPSALPAWDLSPAQEAICRQVGLFAIQASEARDMSMPRSHVLRIIDQAVLSSNDTLMYIAVVHGIYDAPTLGGTTLYHETIYGCRLIHQERYETEAKALMRTQMATICAKQADLGVTLAAKARTLTQLQAFRMLQDVDPDYANKVADYKRLVPFVYQRRRMDPAALRVAVTQHCREGLQDDLKQQYGVELDQQQGWRR